MDCSPLGSSVHGILQAGILVWVAYALLQGIFLTQGSNLHLLCLLHWQTGSLLLVAAGKPPDLRQGYMPSKVTQEGFWQWVVKEMLRVATTAERNCHKFQDRRSIPILPLTSVRTTSMFWILVPLPTGRFFILAFSPDAWAMPIDRPPSRGGLTLVTLWHLSSNSHHVRFWEPRRRIWTPALGPALHSWLQMIPSTVTQKQPWSC